MALPINQIQQRFPRTLTAAPGTQPGVTPGAPRQTAGTTIAPDQSVIPYHPNLPGGQQHQQITASLGQAPGPSLANGQFNTAIHNGGLPDYAVQSASNAMRRPVASPVMSGVTGQQGTDLSAQFQDLMRAKTMAGDIDLRRNAAEIQADSGLRRQVAMAESGIEGGNLMARLNEGQMAAASPFRNLLMQLLAG